MSKELTKSSYLDGLNYNKYQKDIAISYYEKKLRLFTEHTCINNFLT